MYKLEIRRVCKQFTSRRGRTEALVDVSVNVPTGEFVCLLGPSGCGKSTLLNIIAGLDRPDSGEVLVDGNIVMEPGPDRVVMFQESALFPWLNVEDNVAFGLAVKGMPRSEQKDRVDHFIKLVGLASFHKAYIHELSGGMKQRVALARALVLDPEVLLMDEPFAALDAMTRDMLHDQLQLIWADTGKTIVFVTHNVREALVLGDRVLLMSTRPGRIKRDYYYHTPRPRQMEDHSLVDAARELLDDLRGEVVAATREEAPRERVTA